MLRVLVAGFTAATLVVAGTAASRPKVKAQTGTRPAVNVTVAKDSDRIYAYGKASPGRRGRLVSVQLTYTPPGGRQQLVLKGDRLGRPNRKGQSRYEVTFPRPAEGDCSILVRYEIKGTTAKDQQFFPCGIPAFGSGTATFSSSAGAIRSIGVQIADDDVERSHGLRYRRQMNKERGMAFLFPDDTMAAFDMRDTLIPLSIAFFDSAGRILEILHMRPCYQEPCPLYTPSATYRGALEVNRYSFKRWGFGVGDFISVTES
jgi:uncharacterized membrane protein (UPF0127 family)